MRQPTIKSNRQLIRIWYEFLRLSYEIPELKDNLKKSRAYYRKWGTKKEILTTKFDKWWTDHKTLFEGVDLLESDTISKDPLNLNVIVPIDAPIKESLGNFEKLLRRKKNETKDLKRDYSFSKPKNRINGRRLYEILLILRYWVEQGKTGINQEFIKGYKKFLGNRKMGDVWRPKEFEEDRLGVDTNEQTLEKLEINESEVRRMVRVGKLIATSVSQGVFPGNYR